MKFKQFITNNSNLLTTVLFVVIMGSLPLLTSNDYFIHIGSMIGINMLLALGMHAVTGLAGQINMGQYGFYAIGAYTCAIISTRFEIGFFPVLLIVILISAIFGILVGIPSLRIEGPYLALSTIGFAESVRLALNSAEWAGKANGIMRIPDLEIFGFVAETKTENYYFILTVALICLIIINNLMRSNFGNRFKAIKDDPLAGSVFGIRVSREKLLAFIISAVYGGIAGALYARFANYINPMTFIQGLQVNFMLMIVLGGLGSSWGALLGAFLVTVIYEYTRAYVLYQKIAFGVLMILIVLFMKRGIIGEVVYFIQQKAIVSQHNKNEDPTYKKAIQ